MDHHAFRGSRLVALPCLISPNGRLTSIDWFSRRWYEYTGLTPDQSIGQGWKNPFHPDDMPETVRRWSYSLSTGDEYSVEYRCRRYDGAWRWMLGRALPLRDRQSGRIIKWFGTCTGMLEVREVFASPPDFWTYVQMPHFDWHSPTLIGVSNGDSILRGPSHITLFCQHCIPSDIDIFSDSGYVSLNIN